MRVLMINGSPDPKGCISTALKESAIILNAEDIETEAGCEDYRHVRIDQEHSVKDDDELIALR